MLIFICVCAEFAVPADLRGQSPRPRASALTAKLLMSEGTERIELDDSKQRAVRYLKMCLWGWGSVNVSV